MIFATGQKPKNTLVHVWQRRPWTSIIVSNALCRDLIFRPVNHSMLSPSEFVPRRENMRFFSCQLRTRIKCGMRTNLLPVQPLKLLHVLYSYRCVELSCGRLVASLHAARRCREAQQRSLEVPVQYFVLEPVRVKSFCVQILMRAIVFLRLLARFCL